MMLEREPKRYSAYFRGWCQTFGEHDNIPCENSQISWLFTETQVGFILPQTLTRKLYRKVLLKPKPRPLHFGHDTVTIGSLQFGLPEKHEKQTLDAIKNILEFDRDLHIYLTSHLMYGTSARIMTLSSKKPISIIYKEIGNITIRLG